MKAFLVRDDILTAIPQTWDASLESKFRIACKYQLNRAGGEFSDTSSRVKMNKVSETEYDIDVSAIENNEIIGFEVVKQVFDSDGAPIIEDGKLKFESELITMSIYKDIDDFRPLEFWLEQHQLEYLIPVCKKFGWEKLKEAALKGRALIHMQGTEYAIREIFKLLEIDDNAELVRIWVSQGGKVGYNEKGGLKLISGQLATDELHSAAYARKGFRLTNFLRLHYKQDDLHTWENEILPTSGSLDVALEDILMILQESLPATLRISDVTLLKLGLCLLCFGISTYQTIHQYAQVVVEAKIKFSDVMQYEYMQFTRELSSFRGDGIAEPVQIPETKLAEHLKYLRKSNAYGGILSPEHTYDPFYACHYRFYCPSRFYNLSITDNFGNQLCYFETCKGDVEILARPDINATSIHYRYRTDSGILIEGDHDIKVLKCSGFLPILQFNRARQMYQERPFTEEHKIYEGCLPAILLQYRDQLQRCNVKSPGFRWDKVPAGYQLFYIPKSVQTVYVNDGIETKEYQNGAEIPGYSLDIKTLKVLRPDTYAIEQETDFYVYWSLRYQGLYDVSMYFVKNEEIVYVKQENRYLTEWINPLFTARIIEDKYCKTQWRINSQDINFGAPIPKTRYRSVWDDIASTFPELHCNYGQHAYDQDEVAKEDYPIEYGFIETHPDWKFEDVEVSANLQLVTFKSQGFFTLPDYEMQVLEATINLENIGSTESELTVYDAKNNTVIVVYRIKPNSKESIAINFNGYKATQLKFRIRPGIRIDSLQVTHWQRPVSYQEHLASIEFYLRRVELQYGYEFAYNEMRRPSVQLSITKNIRPHMPYVLIKNDAKFELFYNDKLIRTEDSAIVFAKIRPGRYRIHVFNDYFDKTIEL